jgi:hypothetical protein
MVITRGAATFLATWLPLCCSRMFADGLEVLRGRTGGDPIMLLQSPAASCPGGQLVRDVDDDVLLTAHYLAPAELGQDIEHVDPEAIGRLSRV